MRFQAELLFERNQSGYRVGRLAPIVRVADEYPEAAAMRGQLFDVEDAESRALEDPGGGKQRKIRKVLVVRGVELNAFDHPHHMRKLERDCAVRLEQSLE